MRRDSTARRELEGGELREREEGPLGWRSTKGEVGAEHRPGGKRVPRETEEERAALEERGGAKRSLEKKPARR